MSTLQVSQIYLVQPVAPPVDSKESFSGGPSEELLAISSRLRDSLEGLSAWVQIHALMRPDSDEALQSAAKELNHLNNIFHNAYEALLSYSQQIPELSDSPAAYDMLQVVEKCFLQNLANETAADIPPYGFTSWGELLLSPKEILWSSDLLQPLFEQVAAANWKTSRQILTAAKEQLL